MIGARGWGRTSVKNLALNVLLEIVVIVSDDIPRWRILAHEEPKRKQRGISTRKHCQARDTGQRRFPNGSPSTNLVCAIAINCRAAHAACALPDELCKVSCFLGEACWISKVIGYTLIAPRVCGRGNV